MEIERHKDRGARPEVLAVLEEILKTGSIKSAFYCGYAHEPILRLLHQHLGTGLSVMDYWDRYHSGAAFLADDDVAGLMPDLRPEWLLGVEFYVEGSPEADVFIRDIPGDAAELERLLAQRGWKQPTYIVLADEAVSCAGHPDYTWSVKTGCALGVRREREIRKATNEGRQP